MNKQNDENEPKEEVKGVKGRKIPGPKTSSDSFFDI